MAGYATLLTIGLKMFLITKMHSSRSEDVSKTSGNSFFHFSQKRKEDGNFSQFFCI